MKTEELTKIEGGDTGLNTQEFYKGHTGLHGQRY